MRLLILLAIIYLCYRALKSWMLGYYIPLLQGSEILDASKQVDAEDCV